MKFLLGIPTLYLHKFKANMSVQLLEKSYALLTRAVFVSDVMLLLIGASDRPLA
jgi:hypothetical protein